MWRTRNCFERCRDFRTGKKYEFTPGWQTESHSIVLKLKELKEKSFKEKWKFYLFLSKTSASTIQKSLLQVLSVPSFLIAVLANRCKKTSWTKTCFFISQSNPIYDTETDKTLTWERWIISFRVFKRYKGWILCYLSVLRGRSRGAGFIRFTFSSFCRRLSRSLQVEKRRHKILRSLLTGIWKSIKPNILEFRCGLVWT